MYTREMFPNGTEDIDDRIDLLKQRITLLAKYEEDLQTNASDRYLLECFLKVYSDYRKTMPFKKGDRVALNFAPNIEKSSGWYGSRHFLYEGSKATVRSVSYCMGYEPRLVLVFDDESHRKEGPGYSSNYFEGPVQEVRPTEDPMHWRRYGYSLSFSSVNKISD